MVAHTRKLKFTTARCGKFCRCAVLKTLFFLTILMAFNMAAAGHLRAENNVVNRKDDAEELFQKGIALSIAGDYDKAIVYYTRAIELNPEHISAYINRGVAYSAIDQLNLAVVDYKNGILLDQNYVNYYIKRGNAFVNIGLLNRAITDFSKAIRADPKYVQAYIDRGKAYDNIGYYDKAIEDYTKIIELDPGFAPAYLYKGKACDDIGQYEIAIKCYIKAIELDPKYAWLKDRLTEISALKKDRQRYNMYKRYIDLYDSTRTAGLACRYTIHKRGDVSKLSISSNLFISYKTDEGINYAELPVLISQELLEALRRNNNETVKSVDTPFFIWFSKNILGADDPEKASPGLCYFNEMADRGEFETIRTFIDGFLENI